MLNESTGYKVDFISTYIGLIVDAKKLMIKNSNNRLLDNKIPVETRLFY